MVFFVTSEEVVPAVVDDRSAREARHGGDGGGRQRAYKVFIRTLLP